MVLENSTLKHQINQLESSLQKYGATNESLQHKLRELEKENHANALSIQSLKMEKAQLETARDELSQGIRDLRNKNSQLQGQLAEAERSLNSQRAHSIQIEQTHEKLKSDFQQRENQYKLQNQSLMSKASEVDNDMMMLKKKLKSLEDQLQTERKLKASLEKENNQLAQKIAELTHLHGQTNESYEKIIQERDGMIEKISNLRQDNQMLENRVKDYQVQINRFKLDKLNLCQDNESNLNQISELKGKEKGHLKEIQKLNRLVLEMKKSYNQQLSTLQSENSQLKIRSADLQSSIEENEKRNIFAHQRNYQKLAHRLSFFIRSIDGFFDQLSRAIGKSHSDLWKVQRSIQSTEDSVLSHQKCLDSALKSLGNILSLLPSEVPTCQDDPRRIQGFIERSTNSLIENLPRAPEQAIDRETLDDLNRLTSEWKLM
jgi:chromosome segregation ATPase